MKIKVIAAVGFISLLLAGCGNDESKAPQESGDVNVKELVSEYSAADLDNQSASITATELIVKDSDGSQTAYDLPAEEFFVSIAPYESQTHP